jgi:hypothetical protein
MAFSEGTAVLASAVGQPAVQFESTVLPRSYLKRANAFIGSESAIGGGLNKSYKEIPYHTALYWRFLYENCGGINAQGEDPAAGMQVIRQVLETLYKGEIVDINSSTDFAEAFPIIIDAALRSTPSCRFHSYEESLTHFARAIYMLRLENGRCHAQIDSSECGFADPRHLYHTPPAETHQMQASQLVEIRGSIPSSYGIDLNELVLDPALDGKTLKIILTGGSDPRVAFNMEVWKIKTLEEDNNVTRQAIQRFEPISTVTENGSLTMEIKNLNLDEFNSLGLIITRMDPHEDLETAGAYSIQWMME